MLIRQETHHDFETVYTLIKLAFKSAEHSDGHEQDLVTALRKSPAFVPELALVAVIDKQIVGHILFTEAKVGPQSVLVLAPLSVHPAFQRQGIGTILMAESHKKALELAPQKGYSHILVLGSELYYPRLGYLPAETFGIEVPEGIPSQNFMALPLTHPPRRLSGSVLYAPEFGLS